MGKENNLHYGAMMYYKNLDDNEHRDWLHSDDINGANYGDGEAWCPGIRGVYGTDKHRISQLSYSTDDGNNWTPILDITTPMLQGPRHLYHGGSYFVGFTDPVEEDSLLIGRGGLVNPPIRLSSLADGVELKSYQPMSLAYNQFDNEIYVAWSQAGDDSNSSSSPPSRTIYIASSGDNFNTLSKMPYPVIWKHGESEIAIGSYLAPSLTYDPISKRLYLLWASETEGDILPYLGIGILSSSDGKTWQNLQTTGDSSLATPSMACNDDSEHNNCVLTYPDSNNPFYIYSIPLRFDQSGKIRNHGGKTPMPQKYASYQQVSITAGLDASGNRNFMQAWKTNLDVADPRIRLYTSHINTMGLIVWDHTQTVDSYTSRSSPSISNLAASSKTIVFTKHQ